MPQKCTNCNGNGLVGNGDKPWLMQGSIKTCPVCTGTGKVNEDGTAYLNKEQAATPQEEAPVDNSATSEPTGGIVKKILSSVGL